MLKVLHEIDEVSAARIELRRRGWDFSRGWRRALYRTAFGLRYRSAPPPVAVNKSWDVLLMADIACARVRRRDARVYDVGCFNSEIPLVLWQAGFRDILAGDMDPRGVLIRCHGNRIRFRHENFYESRERPGSLALITALSTIEHGYDQERLLGAVSRLLRPGGLFLASTDFSYQPVPVPPECRLFGLPYRVFTRPEIEALLTRAAEIGLRPLGPLEWGASSNPIEFFDWRFTFVLFALEKHA